VAVKAKKKKARAKKKNIGKKRKARGKAPAACLKCGSPTDGKAKLCFTCVSKELSLAEEGEGRAVLEQVKERLTKKPQGGPVCPYCRAPLNWQNIGVMEYEASIYVREKIHYCPVCRALLSVSSWHSEG
jgi:RNA polymerase subunit RPABC4/transcription elongation factor Spt4